MQEPSGGNRPIAAPDRVAGIVLCGGKSSRMGRSKAMLPFGAERMLQRVVRILRETVEPIIVVAAQGQELPPLPPEVLLARDEHPERGPLEGIRAGLAAVRDNADAVYISGCDVPLLKEGFVRRMIEELGRHEIAVPREGKFYHPLAAVYRATVLSDVEQLLAEDRLRPFFLFESCDTRTVPVESLREVDPQLDSLRNLNRPQDYAAALEAAGFPPPGK